MTSYSDSAYDTVSLIDSNNTELFLNPFKIADYPFSDGLEWTSLTIDNPHDIDASGNLIINGVTVNQVFMDSGNYSFTIDTSQTSDVYFFFQDTHPENFELLYTVTFSDSSHGIEGQNDVSFHGRIEFSKNTIYAQTSEFTKNATALLDIKSSFLLMRTNPLLTGNIKIVTDSSDNIWLDTFKVNQEHYKKRYRKQSVSANSNYNTDVRNIFSTMTSEDLYAFPSDDLKVHTPFSDYARQYNMIYSYGAEANSDELYNSSFRFLAPLHINDIMPDYFVIFRMNGSHSPDYYKGMSDTEIFKDFIVNGQMIQSYNLKTSSAIGQYLHTYQNTVSQYPGSVMLQFKEQENSVNRYENGLNSWIGISVDSGMFNKLDEISYFANKVISDDSQELLDQFVTEGFKRNRLLCPDILNLEFMFDDPSVDNFEINRYFGLYLKENDIVNYNFIEKKQDKNKSYQIRKYDSYGNEVDDSAFYGSNSILSSYPEHLFFAVGPNKIGRIHNDNELNNFLKDEAVNVPYRNTDSFFATDVSTTDFYSFITLKFKHNISYGEHYRIILPVYTEGKISVPVILEFIASNNKSLIDFENMHASYVSVINHNTKISEGVYYRSRVSHDSGSDRTSSQYYDGDFYKAKEGQYISDSTGAAISPDALYNYIYSVKYRNKFNATGNLLDTESINSSYDYASSDKYPYIFRIPFYTQSIFDETMAAPLSEQINRLTAAIDFICSEFDINISVKSVTSDSVSILSQYEDTFFQHFTSDILNYSDVSILSMKIDSSVYSGTYIYDHAVTDASLWPQDPDIEYFGNSELDIKCCPLSPDTEKYTNESIIFAPLDFELAGWRSSSCVRFESFKENMYELQINDTSLNSFSENFIIQNTDGIHRKTGTFSIESDVFITSDRTYISSDGIMRPTGTGRTEKYAMNDEIRFMQSPFNLGRYLIFSDNEIPLVHGRIDFYEPVPVSLSLMGIMPVKDMNTDIGITYKKHISSDLNFHVPPGNDIYINDNLKDYNISSGIYYILSSGSFSGIPISMGSSFIIMNEMMYFRGDKDNIQEYAIHDNKISVSSRQTEDTIITSISNYIKNDYYINLPYIDEKGNYKDMDMNNDLKYPFSTPVIPLWKSTGLYYDHNSVLDIENINSPSWKDITKGYMCFHYPYTGNGTGRYISKSLDGYVNDPSGDMMLVRDYILYSGITDTMTMFLSENVQPEYTIGYYNKYINKLEFVIYGIKFSIGFTTNDYIKEINLSNYNKYGIFIFNDFTGQKNEMIINTVENIILIVNHNFNYRHFDDKVQTFYIRNHKFTYNSSYNWSKDSFHLDIINSEADASYVYIPIESESKFPDAISNNGIYQYNSFEGQENFIFNINVNSNDLLSSDYMTVDATQNILTNYGNSGHEVYDSVIMPSENDVEYLDSFLLNPDFIQPSFGELADSSISSGDLYEDMISFYEDSLSDDNFKIYVKNKNLTDTSVYEFDTSSTYEPLSITYSKPEYVKYNIDFYNPVYTDIIDFNINEQDDFISALGMNFILANTSFRKLNGFSNFYGFKIFGNASSVDLSGIKNNYFKLPSYSLIASSWDASYYRSYSSEDEFESIPGYMTGIEKKSFFGSAAIKIKDVSFTVDSWLENDIETAVNSETEYKANTSGKSSVSTFNIIFNLTQTFCECFLGSNGNNIDLPFDSNWKDFNYNSTAMNNYIKLTLIKLFQINNKNNFRIYSAPAIASDDRIFLYDKPADTTEFSIVSNFDSDFYMDNDYLKLKITLNNINCRYYAEFDFHSI